MPRRDSLERFLVRLYPNRLKREHGEELRDWLLDHREANGGKRGPRYWSWIVADLARAHVATRLGGRRGQASRWPRRGRGDGVLIPLLEDLQSALRSLVRSPAFFIVAAVTLALGVGAVTAIYSLVDAVLVSRLPYPEPERLLRVGNISEDPAEADQIYALSALDFFDLQERNRSFDSLAASRGGLFTMLGDGEPEAVFGAFVSAEFFAALGVQPAWGRAFLPEEDVARAPVVVVSHDLWQRRWQGDSELVGKTVLLDDEPFNVIGVMPRNFEPPEGIYQRGAKLWMPFRHVNAEWQAERSETFLTAVGRLRKGVGQEDARRELRSLGSELSREYPEADTRVFGASSLHLQTVGSFTTTLWILFGSVGLLLLIACVNVANLLLVRAIDRGREMALRRAIGAGRGRIISQLLNESLLLGVTAGLLGAGLAWLGVWAFRTFGPIEIPRMEQVGMGGRVLAFAIAVSVLTSLLFGLLPALRGARGDLVSCLKGSRAVAGGARRQERLKSALVVAETALAVVLVAGAGLLAHSFLRLQQVELGFKPQDVHVLSLASDEEEDEARIQFFDQALEGISTIPGVDAVGSLSVAPLSGGRQMQGLTFVGKEGEDTYSAHYQVVRGEIFEALGIPLSRGRLFSDGDRAGSPLVALVNQTMARDLSVEGDILGRRFTLGKHGLRQGTFEIVGVVGDIKQQSLAEGDRSQIYFLFDQAPRARMSLFAKARGGGSIQEAMRQQVWAIDPNLPIRASYGLGELARESVARPRFLMNLLGAMALLALALSLVGIYGILSVAVSERIREVGLRMALGATGGSVLRLMLTRGLRLVGLGVLLGTVAALLATRALRSLLFEVAPGDPLTLVTVVVAILAAGLGACYLPARRATRLDPARVLRGD